MSAPTDRRPTPRAPKADAEPRGWSTFRVARTGVLLVILVLVALASWSETRRIASWERPLVVMLHPIVVDKTDEVERYVLGLDDARFEPIERFFDREAARHGVRVEPHAVDVVLGGLVHELPPEPPESPSMFDAIRWSLGYRWWVFKTARKERLASADVRIFLPYHAARPGRALERSVGIAKVRSGVAHVFASETTEATNLVVIAHELLHTVGASDKYDETGRPRAPEGLGDPAKTPRYPQEKAELMAGAIALSEREEKLAESLDVCVVGPETAKEIGWP